MLKRFIKRIKLQYLSLRGSTLYLAQAPLWLAVPITLFRGQLFKTAALAVAIACLTYGASLTRRYYLQMREHLLLEQEDSVINDERKTAMGFISLGVFVLALIATRRGVPVALIASALAALGYYLHYLAQPYLSPDSENDRIVSKQVQDNAGAATNLPPTLRSMLANAQTHLADIKQAATLLNQSEQEGALCSLLNQIQHRGDALIAELSKDANRVREARTLLVVHLPELADITRAYASATQAEKAQSRQQFSALLDTIHQQLTAQYRDISNLEQQRLSIQIDVLQERLEQPRQHE